jgi:hypothetical protein
MENDIRQQVDGTHEMLTLDGCIEDRVFLVGESIQIAPEALKTVEYLHG